MNILEVTATEEITVPEGSVIVLAPTGIPSGIRLPNGEFLKPWIKWELFPDASGDNDAIGDLTDDELIERDVHTGLDFEREISVTEGNVPVDDSAVTSN